MAQSWQWGSQVAVKKIEKKVFCMCYYCGGEFIRQLSDMKGVGVIVN